MTREFGSSGERRREIEREQLDNQTRNERYDEELRRLGQRTTRVNRLKLALWDELGRDATSGETEALERRCVYTGRQLSKTLLFSDEIEIDHVLPFSKSLHDGTGNKVLCVRQANRDKGDRTPFDAFGHSPGAYRWEEILERAARLPGRKPRLFQADALEHFLDGRDFLDRQLTDTGYLARAAKRYLSAICPPDQIWVTSGRLTGLLRSKWNLGSLLWEDSRKNRDDHRHHALDAAVIGLCSRSLIQRIATAAARAEQRGENRLLEGLGVPWMGFRDELQRCLQSTVVSHKPDHGREARLHNDTNYGLRGAPDAKGVPLVGRHVPIDSLTSLASLEGVSSAWIRTKLAELITPLSGAKAIREALHKFSAETGVRRVMKEERLSVIPINDRRTGTPYRYVKGDANFCYDIFQGEDGRWRGEIVSTYQANRPKGQNSPSSDRGRRSPVMRLHGGDMVSLLVEDRRKVMRIVKITEGFVALAEHHEANVDARNRDKSDSFKYVYKSPSALQAAQAQLVGVSILGYVNARCTEPSDGRSDRRDRQRGPVPRA
jgi:CRISPR-associated endonuclease Csn1